MPGTLLLAAVMGLIVGSFLNVCIHRLPRGESIVTPPSRCPSCGRPLRWRDNVPVVSWLLLRGRCGGCQAPIPVRYPVVEIATMAVFLLVAAVTPPGLLLASRLVFASALVTLFAIDLEHQVLPNVITLPGIVAGAIFSLGAPPGWQASLAGIVLGGGVLYAIGAAYYALRREEGMGMGDVKMLAMVGAFLGWKAVIVTLMLASLTGATVGLGLVAGSRGGMRRALPFGTFLAVGALVAMLAGDSLMAWYLGLLEV